MTHSDIRVATRDDATAVAALIGESFRDLAVSTWLVPDSFVRQRVLTGNFQIIVESALDNGEVHLVGATAAAVWFHGPPPEPPDYRARLEAACAPYTSRFRTLDSAFEDHHPISAPHHYLAFLATRPGHRDRGLGSALLNHHHARLQLAGIPSYLEATSSDAARLYHRHGYRYLGNRFHLPDDGPPLWPMWRDPADSR